ncbi:MAG: hypothetical protein ACRDP9_21690 [Kribbellaceae bacterium]|nr:hypothetical protein [Kribbellaceae bacterium]
MADIRWVTKAQVAAAKLAIDLAIEDGDEPDPLLLKIAGATPMRRPKPSDSADSNDAATDEGSAAAS